MRSLSLTLILIPLLLAGIGCKRRHGNSSQTQLPVSTIYAGDPNASPHFAKGFYYIEEKSWRWTRKDFAVDLSPPLHSDQRGAQLTMELTIPDASIEKLKSVQLSASVQGYQLEPQVFNTPGQYTYTRDVPPDKLGSAVVRIDFTVDHTLPPTGSDRRELGIIVNQVGLVAK
jgi:hypothetical protein